MIQDISADFERETERERGKEGGGRGAGKSESGPDLQKGDDAAQDVPATEDAADVPGQLGQDVAEGHQQVRDAEVQDEHVHPGGDLPPSAQRHQHAHVANHSLNHTARPALGCGSQTTRITPVGEGGGWVCGGWWCLSVGEVGRGSCVCVLSVCLGCVLSVCMCA